MLTFFNLPFCNYLHEGTGTCCIVLSVFECKQSENVFPVISLLVCISPWLCVHLLQIQSPCCKAGETTDITELYFHFIRVLIWRASLFPEVVN